MLESMQQDFVRVARAKGLKERRIIVGHAADLRSDRPELAPLLRDLLAGA